MSEFITTNVFNSRTVNATIDNLHYQFSEYCKLNYPNIHIESDMALTGKAAAIWQGKSASDVSVIVFAVKTAQILQIFSDVISKLVRNNGVVKFKERSIFYYDNFIIEIWIIESIIPIYVSRINVQDESLIPAILL